MSSLKRKASEQLTRCSADIEESNSAPYAMFQVDIRSVVVRACSWFMSFWTTPTDWAPRAESPGYAGESLFDRVPVEQAIGVPTRSLDCETSLKRRRMRNLEEKRSKSVGHPRSRIRYKGGRGLMQIDRCDNEEEARRTRDAYWLPPDLPGMGTKMRTSSLYPTPPPETPEEDAREPEFPQRRHSDSLSHSPITPISMVSSPANDGVRNFRLRSTAQLPTPGSSRGSSESSANKSLEDQISSLLLDDSDEIHKHFTPSSLKKAELEILRQEREKRKKEAEAKARKERRLRRIQPLKPLVHELSPEWEEKVSEAEAIRNMDIVITKGSEGTPIARKDFARLLGRQAWLNDEIVNAYLEWVVIAANAAAVADARAHGEPESTVPKFITQNSFFIETLRTKGPKSTERLMRRKKAPGVSLMEVDSVFVPICSGSHWTIGVVRPVAKTIEYFDSMGGMSANFIKLMRDWLSHQLGSLYREEEWTVPRTGCAHQTNGWDCGVFVCTNALCVAMGLDTSCYYERDMKQQRRNIAAVLINKGFNGELTWERAGLLP